MRTPRKAGIFWVCEKCGGQAVSVALLRHTIGEGPVQSLWAQAIRASNDGKSCPICLRAMLPVTMGIPDKELNLDVCKRCEFVWFDASEYEAIPPAPDPREAAKLEYAKLPEAAREELAIYRAQQIKEEDKLNHPEPDSNWKIVPALLGLPVEMDSDPLTQTPVATYSLSLLITVISILAFSNLNDAVANFGLIPNEAFRYGGLTFLTSFFLHAGIFHLVSNLYFLIVFGIHVENYLGPKRWLMLVALAAFTGNLLHIAFDPRGDIPCIGASGGIAGLIAFYAFKFPHARLGFRPLVGILYLQEWFWLPAWSAFGLWLLLQVIGAIEQISGFSGVSSLAHLGGTAVGIGLWALWRKTELPPTMAKAQARTF
ncbi:MAG TPA: rhomboid family intramembrane serine protease [Verrucomicrobiae bacterium]|jgi:membrane associated rhomboid family serine protease